MSVETERREGGRDGRTRDSKDSTGRSLLFRNRLGCRVGTTLVAKDDSEVDDGELFGQGDDRGDAVDPDGHAYCRLNSGDDVTCGGESQWGQRGKGRGDGPGTAEYRTRTIIPTPPSLMSLAMHP